MARALQKLTLLAFATAALAGCSSDQGGLFQTASMAAPEEPAVKREARLSPECTALGNQIQALRGEGTIDRLEKVATGKGDNVQVKRTALAKQAELNRANADFLAKCGPKLPTSTTTAATPTAPAAAKTAVKAAAAQAVPSGVTAVVPKSN